MAKNFKKIEDLNIVVKVINEITMTLNDKNRTIENFEDSEFAELIIGIGSGAVTLGVSIAAISALGSVAGLSAAGITSGLVAIGGSMVAGVSVVAAAPIAVAGLAYFGTKKRRKAKELEVSLIKIYKDSTLARTKLIAEIENGYNKEKEREMTLNYLLRTIDKCIKDLEEDLNM